MLFGEELGSALHGTYIKVEFAPDFMVGKETFTSVPPLGVVTDHLIDQLCTEYSWVKEKPGLEVGGAVKIVVPI